MSDSKRSLGDGTPYAQPVPSIMLVGVDDKTAETSRAYVPALQLRVADVAEAKWRIPVARPLVIAIGKALAHEEARDLGELARAVGATIVHLESCILPSDVRDRLVNAWRSAGNKRGA